MLEHPKVCRIKRANYLNELSKYITQGFAIVYMDESGYDFETIRSYDYAPIGKPCLNSYTGQAKKQCNVIGALYGKMLFTLDYFKQNIHGDIFYDWCKYTLVLSLITKCVIVMDMSEDIEKYCFARAQDEGYAGVTSFHKRSQRLLNRYDHRLLFLPPYSPDLNPIKKKWA